MGTFPICPGKKLQTRLTAKRLSTGGGARAQSPFTFRPPSSDKHFLAALPTPTSENSTEPRERLGCLQRCAGIARSFSIYTPLPGWAPQSPCAPGKSLAAHPVPSRPGGQPRPPPALPSRDTSLKGRSEKSFRWQGSLKTSFHSPIRVSSHRGVRPPPGVLVL